ncbi:protein DpdJ [Mycolicibacterium sp. CR10]|uniref:protein DpdJ n=1 Tax=Mycolicibacterium sp. CR10 TaxID=2562314 RepID=UPI0010BF69CF|nr:protein DpdJ [Mycolicibacterium sp. CR10]
MIDDVLRKILNGIESHEMPLLSWGVTNGSLSESELEQLVERHAPDEDVDTVIDALLERGLVFASGVTEQRFRSRMAETVRLAARLRRWMHGRPWTAAGHLVSDIRFLSRPRTVPRRSIDAAELGARVRASGAVWTDRHQAVVSELLGTRDVSEFQARSLVRLTQDHVGQHGTVIAAGTGSGKTLAFYLPALTQLAAKPSTGGVPRIIAIYPRVELLRDQLRSLLITCDSLVGATPNVGVLYGAIPKDRAAAEHSPYTAWEKAPDGLICPIIECLQDGCSGKLIWPNSAGTTERLVCDRCGSMIGPETLTFSRDRLKASPPTILFTTTEMVNRELGSRDFRRVLIGDDTRSPEFVLLDEIHTYSGTHGAQVANLLRRWRAEVTTPPHIVGLSATLADPIGFFADLTGLATSNIAVVRTDTAEMEEVGREYFLALRGDPASRMSLLSTTIQTTMLIRRMLDPTPDGPSGGAFGSKLFVFMDDLDVTNRLHSQLQDAEGWRSGGVNRKPEGSLATLRASTGPDVRARDEAGQVWQMAEELGTLDRPVRVARTTSRDGGVDARADIVVATASLEVGFDDPAVGAVIQHKAPRDPAQFIQRRGRAGRNPTMRPWTVVVLSDFGRDRLAFQSYESLFDPVVPRVALPLRNRSILKMQATWWLLDRLSRSGPGTSLASVIDKPWSTSYRQSQRDQATRLLSHVRDQLQANSLERMGRQLQRALSLTDEDLRAVLWDHPRGLIPSVFPTLIRGLEVAASELPLSADDWPRPLADFLPSTLFSPLQTPAIEVTSPWQREGPESEPVSQGMRQFAPGRVSYRYAHNGRRDRLWVEPPLPETPALDLAAFCADYVDLESPPDRSAVRLVQPRALAVIKPSETTPDSSYAEWMWNVAFRHDGDPAVLDIPRGTAWARVIVGFEAFTHRHRCAQTVWRYANGFVAERNLADAPPRTRHSITLDGSDVSVGFILDVDSVALTVHLPESVPACGALVQSIRVARMEFLICNAGPVVDLVPSVFTREWLHQILLSVLIVGSEERSIDTTLGALSDDELRTSILHAAREVFGVLDIDDQSNGVGGHPEANLIGDIASALDIPGVTAELRSAASALSCEPNPDWQAWLDERYLTTLASAVVEAIQSSCPEVDASELRIDIGAEAATDRGRVARIYISEDEPGGLGVVEALVDRYVEDPRNFWSLVETALSPCDGERVDENMRRFLSYASGSPLADRIAHVRAATDLADLTEAWRQLRTAMFEVGLACDHAIVSALSTRLLRPGSSEALESLVSELLNRWDTIESRLGVDVELRVFAYVAASDPEIRRRLQGIVLGHAGQPGWEIGQIVGLLWSRGYRLRSAALQTYSPFRKYEPTDRLLFADAIRPPESVVDSTDLQWRAAVDTRLREAATVTVRAPTDVSATAVIREFLTVPTNVDVLEFHPRVVGLSRSTDGIDVKIELREARQ